ncbi:MDR family MFS transporter [Nocardia huaxiensis]|uniref:Multidrug efflux MFS transporter n=1 Tax=Nocardia huaxiensis TaxID=2755382 RepID=A0A7D6Z4I0_9NOCA|nr:MDR family MFS transporter [Nocardia huaxiensis]QLY32626.1 multidrug efflux MFS transporter [Nocardia huaxiensis]UFS93644.1 multidrug efflux MFS transporter [Nocardia huaxiensis]
MRADSSALETGDKPVGGRTPTVIRLLVLATFVVILNETIMINAIPTLIHDLEITERTAQWVSTAFMLTMAAVIPVTGWFLQRVSTRRAYLIAMVTFLAGTALCAVAPNFAVLLVGRVVQAGGTAVMMPLLMTTLMTVVPEQDRGKVMGNVTLAISVAPAMGPVISGLVLKAGDGMKDTISPWRWLFVLVLPIAAAVTWFGLRKLENVGEPQSGSIDWLSVVLAALGFGSLVYGLSHFETDNWTTPALIVAAGAALIAAFAFRQISLQRTSTPLLDLRVLLAGTYTKALVLMSIAFMAMMGSMILLPLYLQNLRGLDPLQTGLLVMPGGLAMGLLGPTVGKIFDRFGGRVLVIPGSIAITASLAGFTLISANMPYAALLGLHVLLMVGLAAAFTPVFTLGLGALPMNLYSHGSSMLGTLQQVAAAFGTALVVTIMSARTTDLVKDGIAPNEAMLSGMKIAFAVSAVLSVVVIVMAVLLPSRSDNPHGGGHGGEHGGEIPTADADLDAELETELKKTELVKD